MRSSVRPEARGAGVEEVAVSVVAEDGEVPAPVEPPDGPQEVVNGEERSPLPVVEDVLQVGVAVLEVDSVNVRLVVEREQVVEVDLEGVVVLLLVEVQLVSHLVGEVVRLLACRLVVHRACSCREAERHHQCRDNPFHCFVLLFCCKGKHKAYLRRWVSPISRGEIPFLRGEKRTRRGECLWSRA